MMFTESEQQNAWWGIGDLFSSLEELRKLVPAQHPTQGCPVAFLAGDTKVGCNSYVCRT